MDDLEALKSIDQAMNNSYDIIVGNKTLEEITDTTDINHLVFIHDISSKHSNDTIDTLLEYFKENEDYEKCIKLSEINNNNN